jgi:Fe-S-cluster containining protein
MKFDFISFFKRYEDLVRKADAAFARVQQEFSGCVRCHIGCADCCHALFDLTFIEALYINQRFHETIEADARERILKRANRIDRQIYKLKRQAYKDLESGRDENDILQDMARQRVRCPLLNDDDRCDLYAYRPITCRFYGIPTAIKGEAHTCGLSAFEKGKPYPTVDLDAVHAQLYEISADLVGGLPTRHRKMGELLVPLSMALLTVYDEQYLGIASGEQKKSQKPRDRRSGGLP